jgi:hypothetical protein
MKSPRRTVIRRFATFPAVFLVAFAVYLASPVMIQTDSIWVVPTAASMLHEGNLDLDEYAPAIERRRHGTDFAGGHHYSTFPMAVGVLTAPFVWLWDTAVHLNRAVYSPPGSKTEKRLLRWEQVLHGTGDVDIGTFRHIEHTLASLWTALAMVLVFLTARRRVSLGPALAVAAIIAFGTSAWSTASRVLWQHGPSMLAVAMGLYLLSSPKRTRAQLFSLGVCVALAYTLRPTNAITVVAVTLFVAWRVPRQLHLYLGGALLIALPFCAVNLSIYGALLPPYFMPQRLAPGAVSFWEALAGNLVSPSRGLFVFSPVLLLALWRVVRGGVLRNLTALEALCAPVIVLHWLAISAFPHWWGGHSVGPRFFTDVLPWFAYLLTSPVAHIVTNARQRPAPFAALIAAAAFSMFAHGWGAISPKVHAWNDGPPNVDDAPERLWDWKDPQFLRGVVSAR